MKRIVLLTLAVMLLASCSLSRKNPLDPEGHNVNVPGKVNDIAVSVTGNNTVYISWEARPEVDGYFIYRSQSYGGDYPQIMELEGSDFSNYEDVDVEISAVNNQNFYFYKLSAYRLVDGEKLEGYRSEAYSW